jgi:transposase
MRQIKELLRLSFEVGLKIRPIARSLQISPATVGDYLRRAKVAGLSWPLPVELDEAALEWLLFPPPKPSAYPRPLPDWAEIHQELKRKGVTLALLWHEYKSIHPEGLQYSQFCEHYRRFAGTLDLVMRQTHQAGEKLFVDYAGQTLPIIDRTSGEIRQAQIFVAVLGASSYTYAEATWTQTLPDWIGSHQRALIFFGCVPTLVVPDNLKSGVTTPCRYEPEPNATYLEFARHYGVAILPARVRRPRDKAKAEVGVQVVERWVLARLRNQTFFCLAELNAAIRTWLEELNRRPFKNLPGSRRTLFEQLDRPAMKPLPIESYVYGEWLKARVHIDYHVEIDDHYYSVPYPLVKQALLGRLTAQTVELFHRGHRVASHPRSQQKGRYTTLPEHMPKAHQAYAQWTPQRLLHWAEQTGPATAQVIATVLASRPHPQQGFRASVGILRLGKTYGDDRLEAACRRAHTVKAYSYKSIASILKNKLDQVPLPAPESAPKPPIAHPNIRGAHYYH